jgi:hypothetical protein
MKWLLAALCLISCCGRQVVSHQTATHGLSLVAPQGGATFYVGDSMKIQWTIDTAISGLEFEFSPNSAGYFPFAFVADTFTLTGTGNIKTISWKIPDSVLVGNNVETSSVTDSGVIMIRDYFDYSIYCVSDRFHVKKR